MGKAELKSSWSRAVSFASSYAPRGEAKYAQRSDPWPESFGILGRSVDEVGCQDEKLGGRRWLSLSAGVSEAERAPGQWDRYP